MTAIYRTIIAATMLCLAPAMTACASESPETLFEQIIDLFNEQADILNGIDNADDLEQSRDVLVGSMRKLKVVAEKMAEYRIEIEDDNSLKDKFAGRLGEAQGRMQQALMNIEARLDKDTMQALLDLMQEVADPDL
ncbi:MAG: hypothetical protein RIE56_05955 [Amphiplicatus sp.]